MKETKHLPVATIPPPIQRPLSPLQVPLQASSLRRTMLGEFMSFQSVGQHFLAAKKGHVPKGTEGTRGHIYLNRGPQTKVLAVAHLDSVQKPSHFWMNDKYIACPTIDNRLGAWVITHYLPSVGIETDILLTDGEETGKSTARDFVLPEGKSYNWLFSFDRTGTDVACYQYLGPELTKALAPYGLEATHGSYSDIASLGHLKCRGMNFGCAMYAYHSRQAYTKVDELELQLRRFLAFYADYKEVKFPFAHHTTYATGYAGYWDEGKGTYDWMRELTPTQSGAEKDQEVALQWYAEIVEKGSLNSIFAALSPWEWWVEQQHAQASNKAPFTIQCSKCKCHFLWEYTKYSQREHKSYCRCCFMEMAETLAYIPDDWWWYGSDEDEHVPNGTEGTTQTEGSDRGARSLLLSPSV